MARQLVAVPPAPGTRGIMPISGVISGTSTFAVSSRSYPVIPLVADADWL
jgi:hypothetical protein